MKFFALEIQPNSHLSNKPQLKPLVLLWTCVAQEMGSPLLLAASFLPLLTDPALLIPPEVHCFRDENSDKYGLVGEVLFLQPAHILTSQTPQVVNTTGFIVLVLAVDDYALFETTQDQISILLQSNVAFLRKADRCIAESPVQCLRNLFQREKLG